MVWLPHDSWEATSRLDRCVLNICLAWWQYEQGVVRVVPMGSLVYQDAICIVHEDPQYKWPPILLNRKLDVSFLPIMMWKQEWYMCTSENFRNFIMFFSLSKNITREMHGENKKEKQRWGNFSINGVYCFLHVGQICATTLNKYISCNTLTSDPSVSLLHLCSIPVILKVKTEGGRVIGTSWHYSVPSQPRCYDFCNQNLECFVLPLTQIAYTYLVPHVILELLLKFQSTWNQ